MWEWICEVINALWDWVMAHAADIEFYGWMLAGICCGLIVAIIAGDWLRAVRDAQSDNKDE